MEKQGQERDRLFSAPRGGVIPFSFDDRVAEVFPDMIRRSVPGYENIIEMIGFLAGRFVQAGSNNYDLGTSVGSAALAMQRNIRQSGCTIYAVDKSEEMLKRCRENIPTHGFSAPITCLCADIADIADINIENASMVVLNFTLQFVPIEKRRGILAGIFDGLRPGGICLISEKLLFGGEQQELMVTLHEDFKRLKGYSELEISQKRESLENVLVPNSREEIESMLGAAGFRGHYPCFQYLNFCSFLAQK